MAEDGWVSRQGRRHMPTVWSNTSPGGTSENASSQLVLHPRDVVSLEEHPGVTIPYPLQVYHSCC